MALGDWLGGDLAVLGEQLDSRSLEVFSALMINVVSPAASIRAFASVQVPGGPGAGDSLGEGPCGSSGVTCWAVPGCRGEEPCAEAQLCSVVLAGGALIHPQHPREPRC